MRHAFNANTWKLGACRYFPPFTFKIFGFIPVPIPIPDTSKFVQLPEVAARFGDDADFGEQRLAGVNPTMLRGLNAADPRAAIIGDMPGISADIAAGPHAGRAASTSSHPLPMQITTRTPLRSTLAASMRYLFRRMRAALHPRHSGSSHPRTALTVL